MKIGKKMVVVSSGKNNHNMEFTRADVSNNSTTISVEGETKETGEENSYIMIGIDEIRENFLWLTRAEKIIKNLNNEPRFS